jgi:hypothetical protein
MKIYQKRMKSFSRCCQNASEKLNEVIYNKNCGNLGVSGNLEGICEVVG